jgi:hypothetical protein
MLIDCRCPRCNRPVRGREEVAIVKSKTEHQKVKECPACKVGINLIPNNDPIDRTIEEYYYESVKTGTSL